MLTARLLTVVSRGCESWGDVHVSGGYVFQWQYLVMSQKRLAKSEKSNAWDSDRHLGCNYNKESDWSFMQFENNYISKQPYNQLLQLTPTGSRQMSCKKNCFTATHKH